MAAINYIIIILDENFDEKTWNTHQEGFIFRQVIPDSVVHARYKTFLSKHPLIERELIPGVRVTTRFATYQD
jgi:hypothetical protein